MVRGSNGRSHEGRLRPVDLAREHGISAQAVRTYEHDGVLPAAARTPSGYRVYTPLHAAALRTYLAHVPAHGYPAAREILRAVNRGDLDAALRVIDAGHVQLQRDRATLDTVRAGLGLLAAGGGPPAPRPDQPLTVSELAHRLGVTPATLRKWERFGILRPARHVLTQHRVYGPDDVRDADLAHLLRRGGYLLDHIAAVVSQIRAAGGAELLAASLADWQRRLTARGRMMLTAASRLADYLDVVDRAGGESGAGDEAVVGDGTAAGARGEAAGSAQDS